MSGFVRVLAGFVTGDMFQHPQRHGVFLAAQGGQGIQGQAPAGCFGGEKEQSIQFLLGKSLQLRKESAEGFANAGGGLSHQAVAVARRPVHRIGQLALTAAKFSMGKA